MQISDHFHLLKGFTDAAKKFLTRFLAANFSLLKETSHYNETKTGDYWDKSLKENFPTRKHNANLEKKQEIIKRVRELKERGRNNSEIAKKVGIYQVTVARYLKPDYNPTNGMYNTTYTSKIKPYAEDVKRLLTEGKTFQQISTYIRGKGFKETLFSKKIVV